MCFISCLKIFYLSIRLEFDRECVAEVPSVRVDMMGIRRVMVSMREVFMCMYMVMFTRYGFVMHMVVMTVFVVVPVFMR